MQPLVQAAKTNALVSNVVVFALAPPIKHYFSQFFDPRLFSSVSCQWLDVFTIDPRQWKDALTELKPSVLVTGWGTPLLPDSYVDSKDLALRYVCHLAGGVKSQLPRRLIERGVLVSNWGESISHTIAEHAVLLVLGLLRNLPEWSGYITHWQDREQDFPLMNLSTRSLRGKRVGLHGFGAIAREITRMLRPFRVELTAYSKGVPKSLFEEYDVKPASSLEELFATSDIIIECEALTALTRGTVNERLLRLLPENAVFVNVGRGAVVEEAALIKIGLEGRLRIGLDVYEQEPVSSQYPLLRKKNVLLSPHIAGPTEDGLTIMCEFALKNLQRYFQGDKLDGLVSLEIYDRST
ncbi:MAG: hypothetical protein LV481_06395 [Methylacidiphilales bacterium]|nr:hypothetical protein [Candidatus Methylacidiphilales bacterium]